MGGWHMGSFKRVTWPPWRRDVDVRARQLILLGREYLKRMRLDANVHARGCLTGLKKLCQLTGLKKLCLYSNQLTALPESIVALTNLTTLYLFNNPPLIRSAQSAAVQTWLQALEDGPTCSFDM